MMNKFAALILDWYGGRHTCHTASGALAGGEASSSVFIGSKKSTFQAASLPVIRKNGETCSAMNSSIIAESHVTKIFTPITLIGGNDFGHQVLIIMRLSRTVSEI